MGSVMNKSEIDERDETENWSQDCLEYLFENKIWFPVFVSLDSIHYFIEKYSVIFSKQ